MLTNYKIYLQVISKVERITLSATLFITYEGLSWDCVDIDIKARGNLSRF